MEEALATLLLGTSAIASLIGNRLTWLVRVQNSPLPSLVLNVISNVPEYSDEGDAGLKQARVQIDCWALTYASAKALARAVKARLSGMRETASGVEFSAAWVDLEQDLFDTGAAGQSLYRVSLDILITHDST